ncbi:unnamed protein product [Victoria cruziana]
MRPDWMIVFFVSIVLLVADKVEYVGHDLPFASHPGMLLPSGWVSPAAMMKPGRPSTKNNVFAIQRMEHLLGKLGGEHMDCQWRDTQVNNIERV